MAAVEQLALELSESPAKLEQILGSLRQPLQFDLRHQFDKPVFKKGLTSIGDLKIGTILTGLLSETVFCSVPRRF